MSHCADETNCWKQLALIRGRVARADAMARKKKLRLRIHKEARRRARLGVGLPPAEKILPNKREKPPKHKKTFSQLLEE
jgi:hypothetical protein